jgi:hypothetical protein
MASLGRENRDMMLISTKRGKFESKSELEQREGKREEESGGLI